MVCLHFSSKISSLVFLLFSHIKSKTNKRGILKRAMEGGHYSRGKGVFLSKLFTYYSFQISQSFKTVTFRFTDIQLSDIAFLSFSNKYFSCISTQFLLLWPYGSRQMPSTVFLFCYGEYVRGFIIIIIIIIIIISN